MSPFGSQRVSVHFFNIRLPGQRASRDSRWLQSFDSTLVYRNDKTVWLLYNCGSAK